MALNNQNFSPRGVSSIISILGSLDEKQLPIVIYNCNFLKAKVHAAHETLQTNKNIIIIIIIFIQSNYIVVYGW